MYNDYKTHIVKQYESVPGIAEQYGISEDALIKANPNISITQTPGGFFSSPKWVASVKEGDTIKIPFHNEDKGKKGVKTITGKTSVKPGEWEEYTVTEWHAGTPVEQRNEDHVRWALYLLHVYRPPEKVLEKETGHFRFMEKAVGQKFRVVGYMYQPELDNDSSLVVKVAPTEKREIQKIVLEDAKNRPISRPLSYGQQINVSVSTTGMAGQYIYLSLWEDDAKGGGHSKQNETNHNLVAEAKVKVSNKGIACHTFLLKPDFAKMANAHRAAGDKNEGSTHEYYVTAYADDHDDMAASANVNVNNPEHQPATPEARRQARQEVRQKKTKEHLAESKAPKKNETIPPFKKRVPVKHKKPAYEPAPAPPKPVPAAPRPAPGAKPGVTDVLIRDSKGQPITGTFTGSKIRVYIYSTGLKGKKVKMTLYEDDLFDQFILDRYINLSGDRHMEEIAIAAIPQSKGDDFFEGDEQELFVTIEVPQLKGIIESKPIDVDVKSFKPDPPDGVSVAKVGVADVKEEKEKNCGGQFCIKKGDKSELIREINIRLAGFGGNVPTDEFTDRTEKMVKQFQRDYMKVPETGKVCGDVLKAIDEFSSKFDITQSVWNTIDCSCSTKGRTVTSELRGIKELNKCSGWGDGTGKDTYKTGSAEKNHKYEYLGIHRSLLFGFKAMLFYLSKQEMYQFRGISSGYRCRFKNFITTNHQGKALDIQFNKGTWEIKGAEQKNIATLRDIRDKIFIKYLNSKTSWTHINNFSLEPIDLIYKSNGKIDNNYTYSWIHLDVREFESKYLEDKYFCKNAATLNGKTIVQLAKDIGFEKTCNCLQSSSKVNEVNKVTKNGSCFCDRDLTSDELVKLGISKVNADKFLEAINSTMKNYTINTCERKLHFLAQLRHESGEFVYMQEIASGKAYEGRADLGNTQTGDGVRFKGRGLIQITGRTNYKNYGTYKGMDFTIEPNNKKLGELPYCVDSAGWYWSKNLSVDLNNFADKDDIIYISYRINGGFNGYLDDRKPKLIEMIKKITCNKTTFENYDKYSIKTSKVWDSYNAVYKYARLNTSESKDCYKRYLDLTANYLTWNSVKKSNKTKKRIESKRQIANENI